MRKYINSCKIGGLITSIILGAGFLSGKELLNFFGVFGNFGLVGIFLSAMFIYFIAFSVMSIVYHYNILTVDEFIARVFNQNKILCFIVKNISILFMFIIFSAMTSAFSEMLNQYWNISTTYSTIFFGALTFFFIFVGIKILVNFSAFVTPILFVGTIIILLYYLIGSQKVFSFGNSHIYSEIYSNSIIYASYNILTTISLLVSSVTLIKHKKDIYISSFIGALGVFIIGSMLFVPIVLNFDFIYNEVLPLYKIIDSIENELFYTNLYVFLFLLAIITTGITSCFGVVTSISSKKNIMLSIVIVVLGLYLSTVGFEVFINSIYPFFAIFGIVEVYFIFRLAIRLK